MITDGLAKSNPSFVAYGEVFRDSAGYFLGGFSLSLRHCTSFYAKLHAAIFVVDLAHTRSWQDLWLQSKSSSVISCFAYGSFSPIWSLQTRWKRVFPSCGTWYSVVLIDFEKEMQLLIN